MKDHRAAIIFISDAGIKSQGYFVISNVNIKDHRVVNILVSEATLS